MRERDFFLANQWLHSSAVVVQLPGAVPFTAEWLRAGDNCYSFTLPLRRPWCRSQLTQVSVHFE
jgi:hypothetical protein